MKKKEFLGSFLKKKRSFVFDKKKHYGTFIFGTKVHNCFDVCKWIFKEKNLRNQ
jgi:hypothetical protein